MNNDLFLVNCVIHVFRFLPAVLLVGQVPKVQPFFTRKPLHQERNRTAWLNLLTDNIIDRFEYRNLNPMMPSDMNDCLGRRQTFRDLSNLVQRIGNVLA